MRHDEMRVVDLPVEGHDGQHDPGQPADHEGREEPRDPEHRQLHPDAALPAACRSRKRSCTEVGTATSVEAAEKKASAQVRDAGREHVVDPKPEAQDRQRHRRRHDPAVAQQRRARHHRQDGRDHPGRGQEDDVDLGVAEEPEQVLPQQRVAAVFDLEERPVAARAPPPAEASRGSSAERRSGSSPTTTRMYQAKIGIRDRLIPAAR